MKLFIFTLILFSNSLFSIEEIKNVWSPDNKFTKLFISCICGHDGTLLTDSKKIYIYNAGHSDLLEFGEITLIEKGVVHFQNSLSKEMSGTITSNGNQITIKYDESTELIFRISTMSARLKNKILKENP